MVNPAFVWVVTYAYPDSDLLLGTFTIKADLVDWLRNRRDPSRFLVQKFTNGDLTRTDGESISGGYEIIKAIDLLRGG